MIQLDTSWLQHVQKPARYTGGEYNSIVKDHSTVDVTMALAFPDVYEVAMSHLGIKILYGLVNRREDAAAERVFAPWHDMEEEMRKRNIPLFSLETRTPIKDFDVLAFTLQYEMSFTNILNMLDLAGIPMYAKDRDMDFPLLVCGGPCAFNVEPIADFFDIVSLGESEEWGDEFIDLYKAEKAKGFPGGKEAFLRKVAQIPGTYCPALYDVEYTEQGDFKSITPRFEEVPAAVEKRIVEDVENVFYPTKPVVPFLDIVHDRAVLELFRGCTRGCRFCQAGMLYRPVREKTPERLLQIAKDTIANTGYNEISLMSLSSADYSKLPELVDMLMEEFKDKQVSVSLPSLRIDSFSIDIAKKVQQVRKSGLTFAPEAGTQRMRDVINKGVSEEDLLAACTNAFKSGWNTVKLYFMMGLPTETDEDLAGIADLAYKVLDLHRDITGKRNGSVTVSVSFFIFHHNRFTVNFIATCNRPIILVFTKIPHFARFDCTLRIDANAHSKGYHTVLNRCYDRFFYKFFHINSASFLWSYLFIRNLRSFIERFEQSIPIRMFIRYRTCYFVNSKVTDSHHLFNLFRHFLAT